MKRTPFSLQPSAFSLRDRGSRRAGFTFTEVLFAVMILGIGFIMIAGVFPVAISQTASSQEETIGASTARGAVASYSSLPYLNLIIPNDGLVNRLTDDGFSVMVNASPVTIRPWSLVKGNQILSDEPRFAWVAMAKRDVRDSRGQPPTTAQLIIVPVQVRGSSGFAADDLVQSGAGPSAVASLMPNPVQVTMTDGGNNPDECTVTGTAAAAAVPGAVIVLRTGKVYRLGELKDGSTTVYQLLPGNDLPSSADNVAGADAYIVGRQRINGQFSGPSIAIGTYVTYIQLR